MGQGEDADVSSVGSEIDKDRDVSSGILSVFPWEKYSVALKGGPWTKLSGLKLKPTLVGALCHGVGLLGLQFPPLQNRGEKGTYLMVSFGFRIKQINTYECA